jgi:hypothetical protein
MTAEPAGFQGYLETMEAEGIPLLGHLVLYSVFEGEVTPDAVARWFTELGLNPAYLPGEIRPVDVFEKITGPSGVRRTYPIGPVQPRKERRREGAKGREATLMIRPVSRDGERIIRHLVREVRDEEKTQLSYDTRLAVCEFRRDTDKNAGAGAGSLQVTPDRDAIAQLPDVEQDHVHEVLIEIGAAFDHGRLYLTADRLRGVIRNYVESLNAIRIRPTGGVYFVGRQHAQALAALRELARRFGGGSNVARIPIPDEDEMREMVISAFVTRSKEALDALARDLAGAQRDGQATPAGIQALHKRYRDLQATAAEHEQLLGSSLDDTRASMNLVQAQLASLLAQAG